MRSKLAAALAVSLAVACGNSQKQADEAAPQGPAADDGVNEAVPAQKDDATEPTGPPPPPAPKLSKADVVGDYTTDGGDFEEVSLDEDGTFRSFLHARPFYSGTWTLDGTTLTLETDDGTKIVVTEVATTDAGLEGKLDTGNKTAWKRIKD